MEMKRCSRCKREKPYYEFYTDDDNLCINCIKEDERILTMLDKK